MVRTAVAQMAGLLHPSTEHLGVVQAEAREYEILILAIEQLEKLREIPEIPCLHRDPYGNGLTGSQVPLNAVLFAPRNVRLLLHTPLCPLVSRVTTVVRVRLSPFVQNEFHIGVGHRVVIPNLVSHYGLEVNLQALDCIQHQHSQSFIELVKVYDRVERGRDLESVETQRLARDRADVWLQAVHLELSRRVPVTTETVIP